ncbi:MAG: hypothetical protein ACYDCK_06560 [Thermoplasmatota archaeon]
MPAKSICPNCGAKWRNANHLCQPSKVDRWQRRAAALATVAKKK